MVQRVVVFFDDKNVYRGARRAFFEPDAHFTCGNIHPVQLATLICTRLPYGVTEERTLEQVRIYTGRPSPSIEPKSYGAHMRQCRASEDAGAAVVSRPLRYSFGRPPGEQKGVDVALAVDFVTLAIGDKYDIGIIFSTDTDLRPALEFVAALGNPRAEVACWWSESSQKYLSIAGTSVWSHRLGREDFELVADYRDYNK